MQYKIIVDKQSSSNPSSEKKEYIIDIEELRVKGNVYDSLNIEMDRTYVTRRLSLSEYGVLSVLDEPKIEELKDLDIKLFEGDNYIYLMDMQGNKFYAEYLVKNDFNDIYATKNEMNSSIAQTAESIELSVNQKLTGYSTTQEMNSAINLSSSTIMIEVNKKVNDEDLTGANITLRINNDTSEATINADKISLAGKEIDLTSDNIIISSTRFNVDKNGNMSCTNANVSGTITSNNATITGGSIKVGNNFTVDANGNMISKNAQLQIMNSSNQLLMALNSTGQHFYQSNGSLIGDIGIINYNVSGSSIPMIAFNLNISQNNSKGMAWGIQKNNSFYPIFYITGAYAPASSEYGGKFVVAGDLEATNITCAHLSGPSSISAYELSGTNVRANTLYSNDLNKPGPLVHTRISSTNYYLGYAMAGCQTTHFYNCELVSGDLCFYVDGKYTGEVSDKRLKTDIKEVSKELVDIIGKLKLYQFKTEIQKDKIKVGILAQELIEEINKNSMNEEDYALIGKIVYNFENKKEYYKVNYEQFLLLRQIYFERKIKELEEKIRQLEVRQ